MNEQKKTISATERKNKTADKIIVCESYKGTRTLPDVFKAIIISEWHKKQAK